MNLIKTSLLRKLQGERGGGGGQCSFEFVEPPSPHGSATATWVTWVGGLPYVAMSLKAEPVALSFQRLRCV